MARPPHPPVFCVNAVDKGVRARIGVKATSKRLSGGHQQKDDVEGDTPGVLYGCANKGVAEKRICKFMKTKEG